MIYKFKSNADADVLMQEAPANELLRILSKERQSPGILLPEQMSQALANLRQAIAQDEAADAQALEQKASTQDEEQAAKHKRISLRSRAWPLVMMIERSLAEKTPITW